MGRSKGPGTTFEITLPGRPVQPGQEAAAAVQADDVHIQGQLPQLAGDGQPATLTWSLPVGDGQLKGVLPNRGNVAIWIKEARFFLDGVTPNERGNVLMEVSTSGTYQNGFGPADAFTFVNQGLIGDYAYRVEDETVYNPWSINTEVYATPTPFTQWTLAFDPDGGDPSSATRLRMDLRVAYRRQR